MSRYLVNRIAGLPNVEVVTQTQSAAGRRRRHVGRGSMASWQVKRKCGGQFITIPLHWSRAEHDVAIRIRRSVGREGVG